MDGRRSSHWSRGKRAAAGPVGVDNASGRSTPLGPASARLLVDIRTPSKGPLPVRLNSRLVGRETATLDLCQGGRDPKLSRNRLFWASTRLPRRRVQSTMPEQSGRRGSPPILPGSGCCRVAAGGRLEQAADLRQGRRTARERDGHKHPSGNLPPFTAPPLAVSVLRPHSRGESAGGEGPWVAGGVGASPINTPPACATAHKTLAAQMRETFHFRLNHRTRQGHGPHAHL